MARRRQINQAGIVRSFADRLRQARLGRNMTQAELARQAGVPASYVSDLEQAKVAPGIDLVDRLAAALSTTVADLLAPAALSAADPAATARAAFDALVAEAGPDVIATLNSLTPLLRELAARRRG